MSEAASGVFALAAPLSVCDHACDVLHIGTYHVAKYIMTARQMVNRVDRMIAERLFRTREGSPVIATMYAGKHEPGRAPTALRRSALS